MKSVLGRTLSALVLAATAGVAQEPSTEPTGPLAAPELETWVGPAPLKRVPPSYPAAAMSNRTEGWVAVSFIVSKEGKVTDAMIEDSTGNEALERSALAAVRTWLYTPATRNGETVEHPMTRSVIRFELEGQKGARSQFARKFKEIAELVAAGNVPKAQQQLSELGDKERQTLYEDAWYWWLRYNVLAATKTADREDLLTSLTRAIGYDAEYLTPDVRVSASSSLFLLRMQDNDLGGALEAFEKLKGSKTARQSKDYERVIGVMDQNAQKIREAVAGPVPLSSQGHVGTHDYWVHSLVRRSFALDGIHGDLQALEVRCKRHSVTYAPVTDRHTWTVPASWEECGVYVKGAPGATFNFYEYTDRG